MFYVAMNSFFMARFFGILGLIFVGRGEFLEFSVFWGDLWTICKILSMLRDDPRYPVMGIHLHYFHR